MGSMLNFVCSFELGSRDFSGDILEIDQYIPCNLTHESLFKPESEETSRNVHSQLVERPISMLSPFDGLQIDTLLNHLPQRTQLPQKLDFALHRLNHEIDFRFCRESTDSKPYRGVCHVVICAKGAKDVRGFEGRRSARRPGRKSDVLER